MYIRLLTNDSINFIKTNYQYIHDKLVNNDVRQVIANELITGWSEESKFLSRTINFYMPDNINPRHSDFENAKLIYESFNELSESQASDERLWAGLAVLDDVYEYLKYRWKDTANTLRYRVVFHAGGKRGLMYHGIARLWWLTYLTIDNEIENKYELTEFTFNYPHIMEKMIYRNFSNSKSIRHGIIRGIMNFIESGGVYTIEKIDNLYLYISMISGVNLLDSFEVKEIENITVDYLNSL